MSMGGNVAAAGGAASEASATFAFSARGSLAAAALALGLGLRLGVAATAGSAAVTSRSSASYFSLIASCAQSEGGPPPPPEPRCARWERRCRRADSALTDQSVHQRRLVLRVEELAKRSLRVLWLLLLRLPGCSGLMRIPRSGPSLPCCSGASRQGPPPPSQAWGRGPFRTRRSPCRTSPRPGPPAGGEAPLGVLILGA